jgi:hypothetical protein
MEGPLSFVLHKPPFAPVSRVGRGYPSLVSLVKSEKEKWMEVHKSRDLFLMEYSFIRIPLKLGQTP